ncbi:hypothetical protein Moror_16632 [Moniliophthora roreri MCA 2997]|uniref:Uncharacterized protein n=1 Tax=Moniliophthora roreri (strain MCA 2997) TaxID=1381753 RepID=V2WXH8_MONRO|nr:hypothetical protein Moror_16632 [Moniliophthora roreri MCA 2997]
MDIAYLSLSILFDVIVFGLTVYLTFNPTNQFNALSLVAPKASLLQTIQRDGLLYFCTILSGNLVWLLMVIFARPGIKFINAQPSMILTSIMVNRLTLSLRHVNHKSINRHSPQTTWNESDFPESMPASMEWGRERNN